MTLFEAKIRAGCAATDEIFEKAYDCKIPQELKDERLKKVLEDMKPLQDWIENVLQKS